MYKKLLLFPALLFSVTVLAQQEPEEIAAADDAFQEAFFDALTQKGIENYDRAITAMEKCREMQPDNPAVFQELGKNYLGIKSYQKAYEMFETAARLDPKNMWPLVGMYDACYEARQFERAIEIVQRLIPFKKEYREELCSLYMTTGQFDKALTLINELNDQVGKSDLRENYKAQILRDPKYQGVERANLLDQIAKNPTDESNYLALIRLYSESGQEDKALEIARRLEKNIPGSEWSHVNLYTTHLQAGDASKALKALEVVFGSRKIDNKIKHRMLNEFLIFSKDKPLLDDELMRILPVFTTEQDVQVPREVAKFFHNKNQLDRAERFYQLQLSKTPDDIESKSLLMEIQSKKGTADLTTDARKMIELFPLEPKYYLYAGQSDNQQAKYAQAREVLQSGLEYVVDNPAMEAAFYDELIKASLGLGDNKAAEMWKSKKAKLKK